MAVFDSYLQKMKSQGVEGVPPLGGNMRFSLAATLLILTA
jgi:hypothetical protein